MSAPLPAAPTFSLSQLRSFLEHSAEHFLQQNKSITEGDVEFVRNILSDHLQFVTSSDNIASFEDKRKQLGPAVQADALAHEHEQAVVVPPQGFSSVGKVLSSAGKVKSTPSRVTLMMSKNKIVPMESQSSTALSILSSPEATKYVEDHNKDLEIESELVRQMDNVVQHYTEKEDEMISSGIGLLDGMKMKGAIPFKGEAWRRREPWSLHYSDHNSSLPAEFKTDSSATRVQKGFYNSREGDIYIKTEYILRGDHSRIAARTANYYYTCINPAFGSSDEFDFDDKYLEVPNKHSSIYCQKYNFPSPMSNREAIVNIVWKRISEKKKKMHCSSVSSVDFAPESRKQGRRCCDKMLVS